MQELHRKELGSATEGIKLDLHIGCQAGYFLWLCGMVGGLEEGKSQEITS